MHSFKENVISVILGIVISIVLFFVFRPLYLKEQAERKAIEAEVVAELRAADRAYQLEVIRENERYDQMMIEESNVITVQLQEPEQTVTWEEIELIAHCVEAEAGNQSLYGKELVVDVILNRVDDPDFPNTIEEVIYQKYAFEVVSNGMIDKVEPAGETYDVIVAEVGCRSNNEVLFFTSEGYIEYGTPWKKIGDHYFSTKK